MEGGCTPEGTHEPCEAGDRGPGAQEAPVWGEASPLPDPIPKWAQGPLSIARVCPPPAPAAPAPQAGPEEERRGWKWELLTEKPSAPSSWPSQPDGAPLRDRVPSCPWQEKGEHGSMLMEG